MSNALERRLEEELEQFIRDGVYKRLNFLDGPQGPLEELVLELDASVHQLLRPRRDVLRVGQRLEVAPADEVGLQPPGGMDPRGPALLLRRGPPHACLRPRLRHRGVDQPRGVP